MTLTDYMCQEKREEEDLPVLKTALTHQYNNLEDFINKRGRILIAVNRKNTDDKTVSSTKITRKQNWKEKQLYGCFKRLASDISHEKTWTWLRKGNFKKETESLFIAAPNNARRTNHIEARIDKTQQNRKCWLSGDKDKTINHISECSKLAQKA